MNLDLPKPKSTQKQNVERPAETVITDACDDVSPALSPAIADLIDLVAYDNSRPQSSPHALTATANAIDVDDDARLAKSKQSLHLVSNDLNGPCLATTIPTASSSALAASNIRISERC